MLILTSSFSLNMLERADPRGYKFDIYPISHEEAASIIRRLTPGNFQCAIGHPDTAFIVASLLGLPEKGAEWAAIAETRPNIRYMFGDSFLVAQYTGPRLPPGSTSLPEGALIEFWQCSGERTRTLK